MPHLKQTGEMSLERSLKRDQQETFAKDSSLVWQAREDYFQANCPHFNHKTLHDLSSLFRDMIISDDLLDSEILEIQEVWTGQGDLQYANDVLKNLPEGL